MAHIIQIPDELYQAIERYAAQRDQTPEQLILSWASEVRHEVERSEITPSTAPEAAHQDPFDPWAGFRGAFAAVEPDVVIRHDAYLAEEYVDSHEHESE